ncbi:plant specific mitochondrial import receptor subunit TOM20, partial [Tanacetum coccineum]
MGPGAGGGPSTSSSTKGPKTQKSSDLTYDILGWAILAVTIVAWVGFAKANELGNGLFGESGMLSDFDITSEIIEEDLRKASQYHRMSRDHWRSVRRLGVSIAELRDLGDCGDGDVTLGLLKHLRLDNVEKVVRLRLMMKETELKIAEKCSSIRRLLDTSKRLGHPVYLLFIIVRSLIVN